MAIKLRNHLALLGQLFTLINKFPNKLHRAKNTEVYELYPVEDEFNLNKRRKEMGLGSIEEYLSGFNIQYIPPKDMEDR